MQTQDSFTLIELVMVIVIIGILVAVAIPRFDSYFAIKLDGAAKKVISDIRYAQQLAITHHTNSRVVFDAGRDRYAVQEEDSGTWRYATDPFSRAELVVDFNTDAQYKGISVEETIAFQFDWQGVPLAGGSVSLKYHGNLRKISVEPQTGVVRVQ